jgi:hypothetical protein
MDTFSWIADCDDLTVNQGVFDYFDNTWIHVQYIR